MPSVLGEGHVPGCGDQHFSLGQCATDPTTTRTHKALGREGLSLSREVAAQWVCDQDRCSQS